jgi:hypothetical protein
MTWSATNSSRRGSPTARVDSNVDVPAMMYEHAVRCEYAYARLCQLRDAAGGEGRQRKTAEPPGYLAGHSRGE